MKCNIKDGLKITFFIQTDFKYSDLNFYQLIMLLIL